MKGGGADLPWMIVPGAASEAVMAEIGSLPGIPIIRCSTIIVMPAILPPLIHIAVYVVQAEAIGLQPPHRMSFPAGIAIEPGVLPGLVGIVAPGPH